MSRAAWDIEKIVQEVLAALQAQGPEGSGSGKSAPSSAPGPASVAIKPTAAEQTPCSAGAGATGQDGQTQSGQAPVPQQPPPCADEGQLRIASRVVTMAHLWACGAPENLAGVRRVVVRPDALITPLVRDELQRRNILLVADGSPSVDDGIDAVQKLASAQGQATSAGQSVQGQPSPTEASPGTASGGNLANRCRLVLLLHARAYEPAGLLRRCSAEGMAVEVRQTNCIFQATDELAELLQAGNCLGVLLTRHAAIGLCAANRHAGVRAVWGIEADQAASDTASLGANLLVINPKQISPYQLEKMIRQFYQAGLRPCPEVLKSRLG